MSTTVSAGSNDISEDASTLRFQIDALDHTIQNLIQERAKLSFAIQKERVRSGGARVDLSRENEILNSYASGLGSGGKDLAHAILTYCRGDVNASSDEPQS